MQPIELKRISNCFSSCSDIKFTFHSRLKFNDTFDSEGNAVESDKT